MEALHDLVVAGKVRHLGASSMWAWQFAKMQTAAAVNGWTPFVAMQDQYNLLKREEEREMLPMCADMGVGVRARTRRRARAGSPGRGGEQTARAAVDEVAKSFDSPADRPIVEAVEAVAEERGVTMAPGRAGVGAEQARRRGTHRRSDQAAPPRGRRGRAGPDAHRRRDPTAWRHPYIPQEPYWW